MIDWKTQENNWMFVPDLKEFPQGALEISR